MGVVKKATEKAGVSPRSGVAPPKERQFGQPNGNPRNPGGWKKEDTLRWKMEQMFKLTEAEVVAIANNKDAPLMERRIARSMLKENEFRITEAIANQVYGMPKQEVQNTNIELKPILAKPKTTKKK